MDRKFTCFEYDLSQNLLTYKNIFSRNFLHCTSDELVPLYYHSLILSVVHVYKDSEMIEEIKSTINFLEDPKNLTARDIIKMIKLESKAILKYDEYCISKSVDKDNIIPNKLQIHNVLMQIFDFLIKDILCDSIHVNIYLKNLAFTSQGTINLKKTILRILRESSLTLIEKFEVACHYFIDNRTITNLYQSDKSDEEEDYFASNPKFITDYSLYYWTWQIHGTRKLVTETSSFNLQSGSAWSRADFQNDVAMQIIFQKAVEDNNEAAVQHLWINHISEMSIKEGTLSDAIKLSFSSASKINICIYLLFQIQNSELDSLLKDVTYEIMKNIIKTIRWHCIFIEIFKELKIYLSSEVIAELLYRLIESHCCDYPIGITINSILPAYLNLMPKRAKAVARANGGKLEKALLQFINIGEHWIHFLLNELFRNKQDNHENELKYFFCATYGKRFFTELIKMGKLELLENILKYNIKASDVKEIKSFMNIQYVYPICKEFIKFRQFEKLFSFIEWWSRSLSSDQAQSYKNDIMEINKTKLQEALINYESISSRKSLDDFIVFLIWYFRLEEFTSEIIKERNSV